MEPTKVVAYLDVSKAAERFKKTFSDNLKLLLEKHKFSLTSEVESELTQMVQNSYVLSLGKSATQVAVSEKTVVAKVSEMNVVSGKNVVHTKVSEQLKGTSAPNAAPEGSN